MAFPPLSLQEMLLSHAACRNNEERRRLESNLNDIQNVPESLESAVNEWLLVPVSSYSYFQFLLLII